MSVCAAHARVGVGGRPQGAARGREPRPGAHLRALEPLRAVRARRGRGGACLLAAVDELWRAQEWLGDAAAGPAAQLVEQARQPLRHVHHCAKKSSGAGRPCCERPTQNRSPKVAGAGSKRNGEGARRAVPPQRRATNPRDARCAIISAPVPERGVTPSAILAGTMMGKGLRATRPRRGRLGQAQARPAPRTLHESRSAPEINSHAPPRPHPLGAANRGMQTMSGQHSANPISPSAPIDRPRLGLPTSWTFVKLNGQLPNIPTADGEMRTLGPWHMPSENPAQRDSDEPAPCPWPPPCTPEYASPAARRTQPTSSPTTEQSARRAVRNAPETCESAQDTRAQPKRESPSLRPMSSPEFIRAELPMLSSPPGRFVAALRAAAASHGDNAAGPKKLTREVSARFLATCEPPSPPAMLVATLGSRPWMRRSARGNHAPDIDGSTNRIHVGKARGAGISSAMGSLVRASA